MEGIWTLSDAHTHLGTKEEMRERREAGILSMVCAVSPEEAEEMLREEGNCDFRAVHSFGEVPERATAFSGEIGGQDTRTGCLWQQEQYLVPTCGIHPWYADRYRLEDMEKWIALCPVIGEIGMDSVWCSVDLRIQEERFRQQLSLACKEHKPVVLHTKGQEKEIADILREYPNRYLVHWYSCDSYLEKYLEMDCYFSVGPDVWWNPAVRQVADRVPADRLLVETDGLDAVKWAYEEGIKAWIGDCQTQEIRLPETEESAARSLVRTVETVARIRGIEPGEAARQIRDNLMAFISGIK